MNTLTPDKAPKAAHSWKRDPDNWYVERPWCSERLFDVERFEGTIFDPFAGMGTIVKSARSRGLNARGFDLRDRGYAPLVTGGHDFFCKDALPGRWPVDNIVANPPYGNRPNPLPGERRRLEEHALDLALDRVTGKVAFFLDSKWMNGADRGQWLESKPLYRVYVLGPRPSCPPGHVLEAGGAAGNGTTDFAWFVFLRGFQGYPTLHFLRRDE